MLAADGLATQPELSCYKCTRLTSPVAADGFATRPNWSYYSSFRRTSSIAAAEVRSRMTARDPANWCFTASVHEGSA